MNFEPIDPGVFQFPLFDLLRYLGLAAVAGLAVRMALAWIRS